MELYKLSNQYFELEDMDLTSDELLAKLESLDGEFDAKADSICHVLANLEGMAKAADAESIRLKSRANILDNRIAGLREYLSSNMTRLGKKKIESAKFTISCVAGRDKVNVLDEGKLHDIFFTIIPESKKLNKSALLASLKDHPELVEGAELIKSKPSIRIK